MQRIKKKITQSYGASITFALAFFLVAAMVCTTILAASVTAVKRTNVGAKEKEEEQAKLTLESSARLLREAMKNTEVKASRTVHYADDKTTVIGTDEPVYEASGNLAGVAERAVRTLSKSNSVNPWDSTADIEGTPFELTINISGDDAVKNALQPGGTPVKVACEVTYETVALETGGSDYQFDMKFTLQLTGAAEPGGTGKIYTTVLYADSYVDKKVETANGELDVTTSYAVKWNDFTITTF